jgi:formylglycine-generating enzyme required for sulfatase activity
MCDMQLREWCGDWYAPYTNDDKTDPKGAEGGMFKVVRGGYLDNPSRYNSYHLNVWARGALPPSFCHFEGDPNDFGRHNIGFRVVCDEIC